MAESRITEQNPVRNIDGLDYERCAALHNLIVARGWQGSGRSLPALDCRTWWDLHASGTPTAPPSLTFLSQDVVAFLKIAQAGHMANSDNAHTFHRYLIGLSVPEMLNENAMFASDEDSSNKQRYITLYQENPYLLATHALGLMYDQTTHRAIHVESLDNTMAVENGRQQWLPLEVILEGYLQMIDQGKIQALGVDYEPIDGDQEAAHPWIMPSYTEHDLAEATAAWNLLVAEVEQRMGIEDQTADGVPSTIGFSEGRLNLPPRSFAIRFIQAVRKPRFTFLAPGLRLPTQQPFAEVPVEEEENQMRPTLLLENDLTAHIDVDRSPYGHALPVRNFEPDLERAITGRLPAGLYLTESNPYSVHPFGVSENIPAQVPISNSSTYRLC